MAHGQDNYIAKHIQNSNETKTLVDRQSKAKVITREIQIKFMAPIRSLMNG
jgi:hypothetical protein